MATFMRPYAAQTYALMRIVTGFLFLWHGTQKLLSIPSPPPPQVPSFVIAIAGPIELIGGTLVMIGLFTGWAAFLCSGLVAFAYSMGHGMNALLPIQNMGASRTVLLRFLVHLYSRLRHLECGCCKKVDLTAPKCRPREDKP